ncbi:MAG: PH domain-containing protein [Blastocatellia bacterium]
MWCHRCGKALPLESKFCNACGAGTASERVGETRNPAAAIHIPLSANQPLSHSYQLPNQPDDDETVIFRIRPSFFAVGKAYASAAIFSLLAMAVFGYFRLPLSISLVVALLSFINPLLRHVRRNRTFYTLTPSKIEIDSGIFARTVRNIPLRNAQDVTVSATMFERLIKVGDVIIDSAAQMGKIQMRQIPNPRKHAELILQQLQQLHR